MRLFQLLAACLFVVFAPVSAFAQAGAPAGVAVAAVRASPSGPQIGPDEQLYPIGDGSCAAVDRRNSPELPEFYRSSIWLGACRFGVADGKGYLWRPNKFYYPNEFFHGLRTVTAGQMTDWKFAAQDSYLPNQVRFGIQMKTKTGIAQLDADSEIAVLIFPEASWKHSVHHYAVGTFTCPYTKLAETVMILDKSYEAEARRVCGQNPGQKLSYIAHSLTEYGADEHQSAGTAALPNPVLTDITVCPQPQGVRRCDLAFQKVLAPFRERIDRVIAGDEAAQALAARTFDDRYAPMEAAETARLRAIAARLAREPRAYPPLHAPVAASPPPAAPKPAAPTAGARKAKK